MNTDSRHPATDGRPKSNPINDGGPAFPVPSVGTGDPRDGMTRGSDGMTLRDWFAANESLREFDNPEASIGDKLAAALAGEPRPQGGWSEDPVGMIRWDAKWRSALKYIRADAMITARDKGAK